MTSFFLTNIDFLSVGIAIAANLTLGFLIFFNNRQSATGLLFLFQTIVLSIYSMLNYLAYRVTDLIAAIWIERLVMFFSVPTSIVFVLLMHTIPDTSFKMDRRFFWGLLSLGGVTMIVTLSPLVFSTVKVIPGIITPQPVIGPGIFLFLIAAVLTIPLGIYFLIRRYLKASSFEKLQLKYVLIGATSMFSLILFFNFIFPIVFGSSQFIPLSAIFTLPFVVFTSYAIFKHHLLNTKVISTEILTFVLSIVTLFEVVASGNILDFILRIGVFVLVLIFGLLLIQSVVREVQQREELERLNKQIEEKNAQLETLSHFKSELLSLASHQVRSPLAAMKGFITLILQGSYGPVSEKVKETLGKVERSADGLIGLINTLLDLRKVDEGKMEYKFEKADLGEMVASVVDGLSPLAEAKKLALTFDFQKEQTFVSVDKEKFRQVLQNLIDNAIKYTPEGFVKVGLAQDKGKAVFTVTDSGLGIPQDLIPYLFEEFVRDARVKQEIRGTGLGLYIARKIVEAHGGTIAAASEGEGKGSVFTVSVPLVA